MHCGRGFSWVREPSLHGRGFCSKSGEIYGAFRLGNQSVYLDEISFVACVGPTVLVIVFFAYYKRSGLISTWFNPLS